MSESSIQENVLNNKSKQRVLYIICIYIIKYNNNKTICRNLIIKIDTTKQY